MQEVLDRVEEGSKICTDEFRSYNQAVRLLQGELYARRLSCFKKLESDSERGDGYEAASVPQRDGLTINLTGTDLETGITEGVTIQGFELGLPPLLKPKHFDHLNIFCMCAVHSGNSGQISEGDIQEYRRQIKLPEQYIEFGRYAVVIVNTTEFLKRVGDAGKRNGYGVRCDLVTYYDPEIGTTLAPLDVRTIFTKRKRYAYQKEFRIVINSGTTGDEAITLNIGEINDIAIPMDTSDIVT